MQRVHERNWRELAAGLGLLELKELEVLDLSQSDLAPEEIAKLATLENLIALNINPAGTGNREMFRALARLKNLKLLELRQSLNGIEELKNLASLRILRIYLNSIGQSRLNDRKLLTQLSELHLPNAPGHTVERIQSELPTLIVTSAKRGN